MTYTPWLKNLFPNIYLIYLSGYYKIDDKNTVSSSFRYFSLGTITFTSLTGAVASQYNPTEFAMDVGYSRKITDHFSVGVFLRHIHSDLTSGQLTPCGQETKTGISVAGDLGLYYQEELQVGSKHSIWAVGLNISNVGAPISYTDDAEKTPIPTNLRMGSRFSYHIDQNHNVSFHADLNKLLVPTPGVYDTDTATGDLILIRGMAAPGSVVLGMF